MSVKEQLPLLELLDELKSAHEGLAAGQIGFGPSVGRLGMLAKELEGRRVNISGTLTNRELERAGQVRPVENLAATVTGAIVEIEPPYGETVIGEDYPIITFTARTNDGRDERLVGELHDKGVRVEPAYS